MAADPALESLKISLDFDLDAVTRQSLDAEQVVANYANGRLTVTVPAAPQAQARRIEITSGAADTAELTVGQDQTATDQPDGNPTSDTE